MRFLVVRTLAALVLLLGIAPASILTLALTGPAIAEIAGTASVIDGDTIEVHGQRIRLHGIDAPEAAQTCPKDGQEWRCGQQASLALADQIGRQPVACEEKDVDRYGRIVAKCSVAGADLSEWMALNGWAVAYVYYSYEYTRAEFMAKQAKRGIWAGTFVMPWEWRRGERLAEAAANDNAADQCAIKGNISNSGERIYHVPGGQYYDRTVIDTPKGERLFCTEAKAVAAGWRKSKR